MLQKQKQEIKLEIQEDLNRSHFEIIAEQREMNKQLMEGLVLDICYRHQSRVKVLNCLAFEIVRRIGTRRKVNRGEG